MTPPAPPTITDRARALTRDTMQRVGLTVHKLGIHPDWITWAGLAGVALAAFFAARGEFLTAFLVGALSTPLDALDGAVARAMGRTDRRGAVLDSLLDRYADGLIFGALCYYFAVHDQSDMLLVSLAALLGSFGVSYVRARAGEAGLAVKGGLFDRFVRLLVLALGLLIPALLTPALWVLAIGTNLTAGQRLWYVYQHLDRKV